jgi:hypothetical protein
VPIDSRLSDVSRTGEALIIQNFEEVSTLGLSETRTNYFSRVFKYSPSSGVVDEVLSKSPFVATHFGNGDTLVGNLGGVKISSSTRTTLERGTLTTRFPDGSYGSAGGAFFGRGGGYSYNDLYFLNDGNRIATNESYSGFNGQGSSSATLQNPDGSTIRAYGSTTSSRLEDAITFASGGFAFGTSAQTGLIYGQGQDLFTIDNDSYSPGSEKISSFLSDSYADSGYLLGATYQQDGSAKYYIGCYSAVPEPMTVATLGLGLVGLARKRRNKR